jgi:hypothetical protein
MTRTAIPPRVYDDFTGPELDPTRWAYLEFPPGPDGTSWRCEEPSARTTTGDGLLTIHVERFERAHDQVQIMDNPKHLLLSTEPFAVPASSCLTVSAELGAAGIRTAPRDYRDGVASLNVLDLASGWVFDLCASGDAMFAIHERLPVPGVARPFTHVVEHPLAGLAIGPGRRHHCEVRLDAGQRTVDWRVDGVTVFDVRAVDIPERVTIGLGLITLHPIVDGVSTSLRGQGIAASFGAVAVGTGRA